AAYTGHQPIRDVLIPRQGVIVQLKGYGLIKVFKIAATNGSIEFGATNDLLMTVERCADEALRLWRSEEYQRGLKQFCGIERAQHRTVTTLAWPLEYHRLRTDGSWFEAKTVIGREAVQAYLAQLLYLQLSMSTAFW
ncbi:MAG TPA: IS701 family transposase, partial [Anaerolineae bacterium]|nr:IS701 family transposase [Anaerolineae bacterium]